MGIFASRPEEPFEWAGLPSEPARPETDAERLDGALVDTSGLPGLAPGSVVVAVPVPVELPAAPVDDAGE